MPPDSHISAIKYELETNILSKPNAVLVKPNRPATNL